MSHYNFVNPIRVCRHEGFPTNAEHSFRIGREIRRSPVIAEQGFWGGRSLYARIESEEMPNLSEVDETATVAPVYTNMPVCVLSGSDVSHVDANA